jgi:integrase
MMRSRSSACSSDWRLPPGPAGELCALRWCDVDLDEGTVLIEHSIMDGAGGYVERSTKTHVARRIAIGESIVRALADHRFRMSEVARAFNLELAEDAYVFSYEAGGRAPWRPDGVTHRFTRLRDVAGLGQVRLHDLRHFAATRMLAGGVSAKTVAGRLGHANASMTLNVYSHFLQASDREAADVLGRVLDGA